jgi:hypothetical protein
VAQIPERGYSIIECYPSSSDIAQSPERQSNTPSQTYLRKAAFQNVQATIEHAGAHNTVNIYPTTINIYPSINSYPSVNAPLKPAAPNISKPLSKIPRLKKPTPTSPTPPPVELATCENPYIYKYRVYDLHSERCTLGIGLKFPSPTSALGQQWAQYSNTYFGTKHAVYKNQEVEVVGPFRSAAIWEMVGKTFEKGEREKKMRRKAKNSRGQWSDVDFEMRKSLEGGGGLEELRAMEENEELF